MTAVRTVEEQQWVEDNYLEPRLFDTTGHACEEIAQSDCHVEDFGAYPRAPEELHLVIAESDLDDFEIATSPCASPDGKSYTHTNAHAPRPQVHYRMPDSSSAPLLTPYPGAMQKQQNVQSLPPSAGGTPDPLFLPPVPICYPVTVEEVRIAHKMNLRHDVNFDRDLQVPADTVSNNHSQIVGSGANVKSLSSLAGSSAPYIQTNEGTVPSVTAHVTPERRLGDANVRRSATPSLIGQKRKHELVETGVLTGHDAFQGSPTHHRLNHSQLVNSSVEPVVLPTNGSATPFAPSVGLLELGMLDSVPLPIQMASHEDSRLSPTSLAAPWHPHQRTSALVQTQQVPTDEAAARLNAVQIELSTALFDDPKQCGVCGRRFRYPKDTRRHMLIHGEPQFHCEKCSRPFHREDHRNRHAEPCRGVPYVRPRTESVASSAATSPAMSFSSPPRLELLQPPSMLRSISDSRYLTSVQRAPISAIPHTPLMPTRQLLQCNGLGINATQTFDSGSSAVFSQGPSFEEYATPFTAPTSNPMSRAGLGTSASLAEHRHPEDESPLLRK